MPTRRRHRTVLEIPAELIVRVPRSTPTQVGHEAMAMVEPRPAPPKPAPKPAKIARPRPAPWTEEVFVSPSGRIFLPAGFDFDSGRPRALTRKVLRREPPRPRPVPRRARVVIGQMSPRQRAETRESWVVPPHLSAL